jgi:hypothetical protein
LTAWLSPLVKASAMSARKPSITVSRHYEAAPNDCARALALLLEKSTNKAAEPAPEPDGCDDVKKGQDAHTAIENYTH